MAREQTVFDGGYPERFPKSVSNRLFKVSANNVTFKGLTLQNAFYRASGNTDGGAGIYVGNVSGLTVDTCTITNCCVGNGCGGGILFTQAVIGKSYLITNTIVHSCVASGYGGGLSKTYGNGKDESSNDKNDWLVIDACTFVGNKRINDGIFTPSSSLSNGGAHFGNVPVYVKNSLIAGGSGPQLLNTDADAVFDNCTFSSFPNTKWAFNTGGHYNTRSFVHCVLKDTYLRSPSLVDFNCCVFSNITYSGQTGGAPNKVFEGGSVKNSLWIHNQQPIVAKSTIFENCSIVSNYVGGIVMALAGEKATFKNCVIAGNKNYYQDISVSSYGGASFNYRNGWKNGAASSLTLINCYIEGADKISVYQYAGIGVDKAVYPSGSTAPILAFDTTGASDRIFERARQAGPGFVDAENGDWHLSRKSPLRDAGLNDAWMANATDLDGRPRLLRPNGKYSASATVDLGCYECDLPISEGLRLFLR